MKESFGIFITIAPQFLCKNDLQAHTGDNRGALFCKERRIRKCKCMKMGMKMEGWNILKGNENAKKWFNVLNILHNIFE